jgi:Cu-processing system permease protein
MRRILAVTEYIFKQTFRNRILNVLIIFAIFGIGFSLVISELAQEVEIKMITDFGLFAIGIFGFLTLVLSITVQMFEETELKTISLIMVKPISRHEYIIGKYLGIVLTILMNVFFMFVTLMIIIKLKGGDPWDIRLMASCFSTFVSLSMLTSTALLLSTIATSVPGCVIFLFFVYVLGHLTVHLKHMSMMMNSAAAKALIDAVFYIIPNMELFNLKDKVNSMSALFSAQFIGITTAYAALYVIVTLSLASLVFDRKEF